MNGGYIGKEREPDKCDAIGVWQLDEIYDARLADDWPRLNFQCAAVSSSSRSADSSSSFASSSAILSSSSEISSSSRGSVVLSSSTPSNSSETVSSRSSLVASSDAPPNSSNVSSSGSPDVVNGDSSFGLSSNMPSASSTTNSSNESHQSESTQSSTNIATESYNALLAEQSWIEFQESRPNQYRWGYTTAGLPPTYSPNCQEPDGTHKQHEFDTAWVPGVRSWVYKQNRHLSMIMGYRTGAFLTTETDESGGPGGCIITQLKIRMYCGGILMRGFIFKEKFCAPYYAEYQFRVPSWLDSRHPNEDPTQTMLGSLNIAAENRVVVDPDDPTRKICYFRGGMGEFYWKDADPVYVDWIDVYFHLAGAGQAGGCLGTDFEGRPIQFIDLEFMRPAFACPVGDFECEQENAISSLSSNSSASNNLSDSAQSSSSSAVSSSVGTNPSPADSTTSNTNTSSTNSNNSNNSNADVNSSANNNSSFASSENAPTSSNTVSSSSNTVSSSSNINISSSNTFSDSNSTNFSSSSSVSAKMRLTQMMVDLLIYNSSSSAQ